MPDGWSRRFRPPLALDDGTTLRTLRDAVAHLAKVTPKARRNDPAVTRAATILANTAEGRDFEMHARVAVLQAIDTLADDASR